MCQRFDEIDVTVQKDYVRRYKDFTTIPYMYIFGVDLWGRGTRQGYNNSTLCAIAYKICDNEMLNNV